jgi:branched-chain amino acid transport system ATP-binding protein
MIEIRDLVVRYGGITALQGISLNIPEGKNVSMVGANGAGKSTTINAISGMVKKASGSITFNGKDISLPPQEIVKLGVLLWKIPA